MRQEHEVLEYLCLSHKKRLEMTYLVEFNIPCESWIRSTMFSNAGTSHFRWAQAAVRVALVVGAFCLANVAQAQTEYSSLAALQSASTLSSPITFEGIAPANGLSTNPRLSHITFSVTGDSQAYYVCDTTYDSSGYTLNGTSSLVGGAAISVAPTDTIAFENAITAFGTEFGFARVPTGGGFISNSFVARLFNGTTQVGDTYTSESLSTGFFGFTSAIAFDRITITTQAVNNTYQVYDNMVFGSANPSSSVPEGSSLVLFGFGLFGTLLFLGIRCLVRQCRTDECVPSI